CQNGHSFPFTF
nr:immunoglobulin light chain junction region [Mus musculus]